MDHLDGGLATLVLSFNKQCVRGKKIFIDWNKSQTPHSVNNRCCSQSLKRPSISTWQKEE